MRPVYASHCPTTPSPTPMIWPERRRGKRGRRKSFTKKLSVMASQAARASFRIVVAVLVVLVLFYVGRPLYWKISATVHDIRRNKQTVKQGLSQIVYEAQKSVGWFHDESDSGIVDDKKVHGAAAAARRLLHEVNP